MTATEILGRARKNLAVPLEWMRGDYCDGDLGSGDSAKFSLGGAIMDAAGVSKVSLFTGVPEGFFDALLAVAMEIGPQPIDTDAPDAINQALQRIERWNDLPTTFHEDVIDLLERAHRLLVSVS